MQENEAILSMAKLLAIWTQRYLRLSKYTEEVLHCLETAGMVIEKAHDHGNIPSDDYNRLQGEAKQLLRSTDILAQAGKNDTLAIRELMSETEARMGMSSVITKMPDDGSFN